MGGTLSCCCFPASEHDDPPKTPVPELDIDINHVDDYIPYIIIGKERLHSRSTVFESRAALKSLASATHSTGFRIHPSPVAFVDSEDCANYIECCYRQNEGIYEHARHFGTIPHLLRAARKNAAEGRGTLFKFMELGGWRGNGYIETLWGHDWAGILVRKTNPYVEAWCLNIYCSEWWDFQAMNECLANSAYRGRRSLWAALGAAGFNVVEVNFANTLLSRHPMRCVINSWYWLAEARKSHGGLWMEEDVRKRELNLQLVARGPDLFGEYPPVVT